MMSQQGSLRRPSNRSREPFRCAPPSTCRVQPLIEPSCIRGLSQTASWHEPRRASVSYPAELYQAPLSAFLLPILLFEVRQPSDYPSPRISSPVFRASRDPYAPQFNAVDSAA